MPSAFTQATRYLKQNARKTKRARLIDGRVLALHKREKRSAPQYFAADCLFSF